MSMEKAGAATLIFVGVLLLGAGVYSNLEGWTTVDSIYFSAVTITTLGYGDLVPKTDTGKIFTIFFSISGIAIGLYILTMVGRSIFNIDLHRGAKITNLKVGRKFNIEKMAIGTLASWSPDKKEFKQGIINEIGLDYIKIHVEKRNGQLVPKKDQKTIMITTEGKQKKI